MKKVNGNLLKTPWHEINEVSISSFEDLRQWSGADAAFLEQLGIKVSRHVFGVKEQLASASLSQNIGWRQIDDLHDHGQLLGLILTRKYRIAGEQFDENAAEGPNVDRCCVWYAQDDFGRPIESTLDIRVNFSNNERKEMKKSCKCKVVLRGYYFIFSGTYAGKIEFS